MALVADWRVLVPLVVRPEVLVCIRVEEEVGGVEARHEGGVVVVDGVGVEEFPCIVGGVAGCLEPEGKPVLVVAFGDEFGVSPYSILLVSSDFGNWQGGYRMGDRFQSRWCCGLACLSRDSLVRDSTRPL